MSLEIFRAEALPVLQNQVFATAEEALASPTGDVVLVQDSHGGLVTNAAFDPSTIVYDQNYQDEQACSPAFRRHLAEVATIIGRFCRDKSIVEVGCGKGFFLEYLDDAGFDITGIDPAYQGSNPKVLKARFERGSGLSADGVVLRHVLEHMPDPLSFLSDIAAANKGRGTIYIEVPCFDWIRRHRAWFDIFYEHVNYFRLPDFHRMFGRVYESGHLFGGQYLYAVADLASLRVPVAEREERLQMPSDFLDGVDRAVAVSRRANVGNAVWGAASKGVMFSLYMRRAGGCVDSAIDINPAKQGRYLAVTALKVCDPELAVGGLTPGANVFVMNSNYMEEIVALSGNRFSYVAVDDSATSSPA